MKKKARVVLIIFLATVWLSILPARRARALSNQVTQSLIITGAVVGVVVLIKMIAIVGASRDEPYPLVAVPAGNGMNKAGPSDGIQLGVRCPPAAGHLTLLCW